MDMDRNVAAFRERFNAYKNGKSVSEIYDAGLPRYAGGKDPNEDVADFLRQYEGYRDKVYLDGNGIPTIGYGFTDPKFVSKGTITKPVADAELKRQIKVRLSTLRDILGADKWDSLTDDSRKALTSYHFNYPAGFKENTKFMKAWRAGNYKEAIRQVDAGMYDNKNKGLRTRRLAEQALLRADPFLMGHQEVPVVPIVELPMSTAVRQTIPAEQTRARWEGAENVSPYLTGKPRLMLRPEINIPNIKDPVLKYESWFEKRPLLSYVMSLDELPEDDGLLYAKNGKLPGYEDGTVGTALLKGGASLIPGVGTAIDAYDFYKQPSLDNLGYLMLSGIGDAAMFTGFGGPFGLTLKNIRNAAKLNKTRKTVNALMETRKANDAIQLYEAKKAYNLSRAAATALAAETGNIVDTASELLQGYKNGKSPIHINPANRGKFTALKKRTGHSASWFKENGTPAQKKMAVFALNAKKWKH